MMNKYVIEAICNSPLQIHVTKSTEVKASAAAVEFHGLSLELVRLDRNNFEFFVDGVKKSDGDVWGYLPDGRSAREEEFARILIDDYAIDPAISREVIGALTSACRRSQGAAA